MAFDNELSPKERLQKVLAHAGIASRRNAEKLILEGAVTVNGKVVTELGTRVNPINDKIKVHGKLIQTNVQNLYVVYYKPKGMITAMNDPEGRLHLGHVVEALPVRVTPIGRMDFNSEGMLLLTNDGALGERILKTRDLIKTYVVKVKGHPTDQDLEFLKRGFFTEEGTVRFSSFGIDQRLKNKSWIKIEVSEGSQMDLRELFNKKGLLVDRIVRTGIGSLFLNDLEPGEFRIVRSADFEKALTAPPVETAEKHPSPKPKFESGKAENSYGRRSKRTPAQASGDDEKPRGFAKRKDSRDSKTFGDKKPRAKRSDSSKRRDFSDAPAGRSKRGERSFSADSRGGPRSSAGRSGSGRTGSSAGGRKKSFRSSR